MSEATDNVAAKRTGKVVNTPEADSWRFENGKAVEFYEFYDTAQVTAAMTLGI